MTITPSNASLLFARARGPVDAVLVEGLAVFVAAIGLYAAIADQVVATALRLIVW